MVYTKMRAEELILRDLLARDRTALANERTLLAYMRTAFGFLAGGFTLVKLLPHDRFSLWLGIVLIVLGCLTVSVGAYRFAVVAARIKLIGEPPSSEATVESDAR